MTDIEITQSERGFEQYGASFATSYGHELRVYESSAADGPHVWLNVNAEFALIDRDREAGEMSIHMSRWQAQLLRDRLTTFLERTADES